MRTVLLALLLGAPPGEAAPKATCVLFVGTDCPIANAYAPELERVAEEFAPKGVAFTVAYPLPKLKPGAAAKHAKEFKLPGTVVHDRDFALAKKLGATVTPEAVVLSPSGEVLYRGRIDDRYEKVGGKRREQPTTFDLRAALKAALDGKPAPKPWQPAVGCDIDFP
jgi:thiol-disulfide isomerase/thioredoxin